MANLFGTTADMPFNKEEWRTGPSSTPQIAPSSTPQIAPSSTPQIAREMWDKLTPVWDRVRADAMVDPSKGLYASRVGEASADVNRTFSRARESERRNFARSGIRPGSGRYQSSMRQLGLAQAAQGAGAMTMARRGVDREMESRRANYLAMSHPLIQTMGEQIGEAEDRTLRGEISRNQLAAQTSIAELQAAANNARLAAEKEWRKARLGAEIDWRADHNLMNRELGLLDAETRLATAQLTGKSQESASKSSAIGNILGTVGGVIADKWLDTLF